MGVEKERSPAARKVLGRYIVADPEICHGKPTFTGTRIMVFQVLDAIATGEDWESISESWGGKVSREAIAEAVSLASQAMAGSEIAGYLARSEHPAPSA